MTIPITFTDKELLRGTIVVPAWYRVQIESIDEGAPSSKGDSINYTVEGVIIREAETGDEKYKNVPLTWMFNSKAMGFFAGLLKALGITPKVGEHYDLHGVIGKEVEIFVENNEWQGRVSNRVNHKYRAVRG